KISAMTIGVVLFSTIALAQQTSATDESSNESSKITVRGCVRSDRGSYILIENRTGAIYALQGTGNKLQNFLRKEVEVTGESKPGSVRTGVRADKAGSNPSDT